MRIQATESFFMQNRRDFIIFPHAVSPFNSLKGGHFRLCARVPFLAVHAIQPRQNANTPPPKHVLKATRYVLEKIESTTNLKWPHSHAAGACSDQSKSPGDSGLLVLPSDTR